VTRIREDEETIGHMISIRCDAGSSKVAGVGRTVAVRPPQSPSVVSIGEGFTGRVPGEGQAAEGVTGLGDHAGGMGDGRRAKVLLRSAVLGHVHSPVGGLSQPVARTTQESRAPVAGSSWRQAAHVLGDLDIGGQHVGSSDIGTADDGGGGEGGAQRRAGGRSRRYAVGGGAGAGCRRRCRSRRRRILSPPARWYRRAALDTRLDKPSRVI
jgi:hypothetical protein